MLIYKKKGQKKKKKKKKKIVASWFRTGETMLIGLKLLKNSTYFVQPELVFFKVYKDFKGITTFISLLFDSIS